MGPALFIDGKNTAYRAIYAGRPQTRGDGAGRPVSRTQHPFVIWMRFARTWLDRFKPSSIHVFWDCPRANVWRRKILPTYKDRDSDGHTNDIANDLHDLEQTALAFLPHINTHVYYRETQEADDLIYAACRVFTPGKVIVISSDSDMLQLPWHMPHVTCYEPRLNKIQEPAQVDPVMQKALMGDGTDNIDGYRGIGEVKSADLLRDRKALAEFLRVRGDKIYKTNLALIDLSLNPHRLGNELYVQRIMAEDPVFDNGMIQSTILGCKIMGLMQDYSRTILPFKSLGQNLSNIKNMVAQEAL